MISPVPGWEEHEKPQITTLAAALHKALKGTGTSVAELAEAACTMMAAVYAGHATDCELGPDFMRAVYMLLGLDDTDEGRVAATQAVMAQALDDAKVAPDMALAALAMLVGRTMEEVGAYALAAEFRDLVAATHKVQWESLRGGRA